VTIKAVGPDAISPSHAEAKNAKRLSRALERQIDQGEPLRLVLSPNDSVVLPISAARLLVKVLAEFGKGNAVSVVPVKIELTTREAAELLSVSRPQLVKILEDGDIPFRRVGTHRRVRLADVLAYKRRFLEERKAILTELSAQAQELDMGYE